MLNLEQTCNNPHLHSLTRTVIRIRLSAWACQPFCCQRTFFPSLSECPECLRTRLAGLTRSHCANLPSSSAPDSRDFAWCLSCPATRFGNPLRNFFPLSLPLNHCRKIKNPASSAGRNHPHLSGSTRCSTSFYPVLVKNPTIGSTSRLRLTFGLEDFFDPTVMPLSGPRLSRALGPFESIPVFLNSSSPPNNYFSSALPALCKSASAPIPGRGHVHDVTRGVGESLPAWLSLTGAV
jgi:hypothetical protein